MKHVPILFSIALAVISSIASVSAASSAVVDHADGMTGPSAGTMTSLEAPRLDAAAVAAAVGTGRRLEDGGGLEFEDLSETPMHEVILTSLKVYGSVFALLFVIFLLGRRYYPKAFLVLRDSEEDATELSTNTFGPVSWIWKVFGIGDEEIFDECGMDAVSISIVLCLYLAVLVVLLRSLPLNKYLPIKLNSDDHRSSSFALSALECVLPS